MSFARTAEPEDYIHDVPFFLYFVSFTDRRNTKFSELPVVFVSASPRRLSASPSTTFASTRPGSATSSSWSASSSTSSCTSSSARACLDSTPSPC